MHRGFAQAIQNNHGFYLWLNDDVILTSTTVQTLLNCYARNHHKDEIGAASIWVILNAGYVLIGIRFMHSRLLKNELFRWYCEDIARPLVGALFLALILASTRYRYNSFHMNIGLVGVALGMSFLGSALATEITVRKIQSYLVKVAHFK